MSVRAGGEPARSDATAETRLGGRRAVAARGGWLVLFAAALVPFALSLRDYPASIEHPSQDNAVLSPGSVEALAHAGITLSAYAWASIGMACAAVVVAAAIALVLFWRRGDDWMALLAALFLVINTANDVGLPNNGATTDPALTPGVALGVLQSGLVIAVTFGVFLLFPSGRFAPRWSWAILALVTIWAMALAVAPTLLDGILFLGYPLFLSAAIACMVHRYRSVSTPVQRQQTKWVVAGFVVSLLANQAFWIPTGFTPLGQTLYPPAFYLVYQLVLLLVPVTFFIAIQRYRLYDIDTIINRALVYGSLTAVLAAIYAAGVMGAQALIGAVTGDVGGQEPVVIVATTLLIAALFRPLRERLQAAVDRRFYRRRYDAAKTLAAFGHTLRQDVDLSELSEHLLAVVETTMEPAHASLWSRPAETAGKRRAAGSGARAGDAGARSAGGRRAGVAPLRGKDGG